MSCEAQNVKKSSSEKKEITCGGGIFGEHFMSVGGFFVRSWDCVLMQESAKTDD